jgi:hypothetical protein
MEKPDEKGEMTGNKVLHEDDIQKFHTTTPEELTDQALLLSTISTTDLDRKLTYWVHKFQEYIKNLVCKYAQ